MADNREYKLFQHQIKAIQGCMVHHFRLIYRLPGTGKTLIAVELIKRQLQTKHNSLILWLGLANLVIQYEKVFNVQNIPFHPFNPKIDHNISGICVFASYEMFRLHSDYFLSKDWDCVICDEFHKAKSDTTQINSALKSLRKKSRHFWAFTGTPFQNSPYEFFELLNVIAGKNISFACESTLQYQRPKSSFLRNFLGRLGFRVKRLNQGPIMGVSQPQRLHDLVYDYIDYISPEEYMHECHLPAINEQVRLVTLSHTEVEAYKKVLKTYRKKREKEFFNDCLTDEQVETAFNNLAELRQSLLSAKDKASSKILACAEDIDKVLYDRNNRVLVFSNFVKNGLEQMADILRTQHISFSLYDGNTTVQQRKSIINDYFSGRIPLMLISPVGFEGLDLYGTTHIFVLDPHFNPERTLQLVSRAIRAFSNVKTINVVHYVATSEELKHPSIDEMILKISECKKKLAKIIESCLID